MPSFYFKGTGKLISKSKYEMPVHYSFKGCGTVSIKKCLWVKLIQTGIDAPDSFKNHVRWRGTFELIGLAF